MVRVMVRGRRSSGVNTQLRARSRRARGGALEQRLNGRPAVQRLAAQSLALDHAARGQVAQRTPEPDEEQWYDARDELEGEALEHEDQWHDALDYFEGGAGRTLLEFAGIANRFRRDFVAKVVEHSQAAIDPAQADAYFDEFVEALFHRQIEGYGQGYGWFREAAGPDGALGRQELVDLFHRDVEQFITAFGEVAAQGDTLLWSAMGIGRFAVEDEEIRAAAGASGPAQPLSETAIGKLWDQLDLIVGSWGIEALNWDVMAQTWSSISKEFARNAKGMVHVFIPARIGPSSVFWNVELPELRQRMRPFMDPPEVEGIVIHRLTPEVLAQVNAIDADQQLSDEDKAAQKRELMRERSSWINQDISDAEIDVLEPPNRNNPGSRATVAGALSLDTLHRLGAAWLARSRR